MSQLITNATIVLTGEYFNRPRIEETYSTQTIRIQLGEKIVSAGLDGHLSTAGTSHRVEWLGGSIEDMEGATSVSILGANNKLIISGEISSNQPPKQTNGGVMFEIYPEA